MNVKELKEIINNLPDDLYVFMDQRETDFRYGLANSATVREIPFSEEPDSKSLCVDKVLVLSE